MDDLMKWATVEDEELAAEIEKCQTAWTEMHNQWVYECRPGHRPKREEGLFERMQAKEIWTECLLAIQKFRSLRKDSVSLGREYRLACAMVDCNGIGADPFGELAEGIWVRACELVKSMDRMETMR